MIESFHENLTRDVLWTDADQEGTAGARVG